MPEVACHPEVSLYRAAQPANFGTNNSYIIMFINDNPWDAHVYYIVHRIRYTPEPSLLLPH